MTLTLSNDSFIYFKVIVTEGEMKRGKEGKGERGTERRREREIQRERGRFCLQVYTPNEHNGQGQASQIQESSTSSVGTRDSSI